MIFDQITPYNNSHQRIRIVLMLLIFIISTISLKVHASYLVKADTSDGGYNIRLVSNSSISNTPIRGSDGQNYYQVGAPILLEKNSSGVAVVGNVLCVGEIFGKGEYLNIKSLNAYHRLFVYIPSAGRIGGKDAYRINKNFIVTIESKILGGWSNITGAVCADLKDRNQREPIEHFSVHFPMTFTFYVNEKIVDGQLVFPAQDLAGYSRAFTDPKAQPPFSSLSIDRTSAPVRLLESTLNVKSSCKTMTSSGSSTTLNIKHGILNSTKFDSTAEGQVYYMCDFSKSTRVKLALDYKTDYDPYKRLPMYNNIDDYPLHADLKLIDEETGQSGKELKIDIIGTEAKLITIRSHLQGSDATAGDYRGSAFLIATFD